MKTDIDCKVPLLGASAMLGHVVLGLFAASPADEVLRIILSYTAFLINALGAAARSISIAMLCAEAARGKA